MLEYREFTTAEHSPLQCVWELRGEVAEQQRITPDGRFELIVHLRDPFEALLQSGWKQQSATLIAGQTTKPMLVRPTGSTHTIGVRLKSWASACFAGLPASELTNQVADARAVSRSLSHKLRDTVHRYHSDLEKIAGSLMADLGDAKPADERVTAAVRVIEQSAGQCRLEEVARVANLSFKQLERLFHRHVGVGPKTLARIRRFSHIFAQLEALGGNWAQIACECGYADQSHLARDFAQFAGTTPGALLSPQSDLAWYFTAAHQE
jgi:AraC-like DNA-binding protein